MDARWFSTTHWRDADAPPLPAALVDRGTSSFIVRNANGQQLAYLYEPQRQMSMKRLSRDEAFLIAVNIAKLPRAYRGRY
jgi:hypothetical protein